MMNKDKEILWIKNHPLGNSKNLLICLGFVYTIPILLLIYLSNGEMFGSTPILLVAVCVLMTFGFTISMFLIKDIPMKIGISNVKIAIKLPFNTKIVNRTQVSNLDFRKIRYLGVFEGEIRLKNGETIHMGYLYKRPVGKFRDALSNH